MVNIIMPAYNAHETIRQAIASVAMQDEQSNILITIVDDCSDESYDYLLQDFHYTNIELLRKVENTGCGQSRQYGIDRCTCEYFMFLDTDDCLYSPNAVKTLYNTIISDDYDYVISDFLEEVENGQYILHHNSSVWMHGKLFKTKFIKDNDIRFSKTRLNEDHAFNLLVIDNPHSKGRYTEYVSYVWKFNPTSLVRRVDFEEKSYSEYVDNAIYTINEFVQKQYEGHKIIDCYHKYIISFYAHYMQLLYTNKTSKYLNQYILCIKKFFNNIPDNLPREFHKEDFVSLFYKDETIRGLIRNNYIFDTTIMEFLSKVVEEKYDEKFEK